MARIPDPIVKRRSIRRFSDREVPEELLAPILESVRWAPSWGNSQCWEIVVVRSPRLKEKLAASLSERNPASLAVLNAPVVLAICAGLGKAGFYRGTARTKFGDWFLFDLGLATQNLALTAQALGLGTVIVGGLDHDRAKEALRVPEEFELAVLVPLGYPDQQPSAPARRPPGEYTHLEMFSVKD
jgi:nitroreductase